MRVKDIEFNGTNITRAAGHGTTTCAWVIGQVRRREMAASRAARMCWARWRTRVTGEVTGERGGLARNPRSVLPHCVTGLAAAVGG